MIPKIILLEQNSPYLNDVIELGTQNSATLGFFPQRAFIEFAKKQQILIAIDEKNTFLGYLLYGINKRELIVYITHLCVKESARGLGVAKALFSHLKELTHQSYRAIRIHCRRDYETANKVWSQLGFIARGEKAGRSKYGSTLTIWWFDHNHPNLFTFLNNQSAAEQQVVVDANIFFDFQNPIDSVNQESYSLRSDWLQENTELCLTDEIFNEIFRQPDSKKRLACRNFAEQYFKILSAPDDEFKKVRDILRAYFPEQLSEQDQSDIHQVARAIAAGVNFFITRDQRLHKRLKEFVSEQFGVYIMQPADFIINQDELIRNAEYQPARLSGSHIKYKRVQAEQRDLLEDIFYDASHEKKSEFRQKLSYYLADPHIFHTETIQEQTTPLALIVYGRQNPHELDIPIFRVSKHALSPTIARYMIFRAVITATNENRIITKLTDYRFTENLFDALIENGFLRINNVWIKVNLPSIFTINELLQKLHSFNIESDEMKEYLKRLLNALISAEETQNSEMLLRLEKMLWPAKIINIDIPAYIVPIRPVWAMHLFDAHISTQDLFGANPNLMFQLENVYYRSSFPKILSSPARILWYISKGKGDYQDVMSIRASSYLEEVCIDKPKPLFSRFKRLGVYNWENVREIAKENINNEIMAFRFSHTETFRNSIAWNELKIIWKEYGGKNFQPQGPLKISAARFFELYSHGIGITTKG